MELLFVDSTKPLPKKARELRDASVRSHAAKISHQRRIKAKSKSSPSNSAEAQHTDTTAVDVPKLKISTDAVNSSLAKHGFDDDKAIVEVDPDADTVWSFAQTKVLLSPQSVLMKGQSDPFDVSPTRIDSKAHELMLYFRDNYLFTRHHVNAKTWYGNVSAVSDWEDARRSLLDGGLGYALLAQLSAGIAVETVSRQPLDLALTYSQRSIVALRKRLENQEDDSDSPRLILHMALLQGAETYARNQAAAVTHGKMLRRLYDGWLARGKRFEMKMLLLSLYADVQMAITFLVRPQFEPSAKLVEAFMEVSDAATREEYSESTSTSMYRLNSQITDSTLQHTFLMWAQTLTIRSFYARRLWTFMNQLNVVNHILDIEETIDRQDNLTNTTFCHVQAYLLLAALFLIRLSTLPEHFVAKLHFAAHTALLRRLRHHLEISDSLEDKHFYSNSRFWALFVGAHSEYQAALLNKSSRALASRGWFNIQLAQQARRCGLRRWVYVREILESFMYFEMVPDPSVWYSELLS